MKTLLAMDLSLTGSAFCIIKVKDNEIIDLNFHWVNNKNNSKLPIGLRLKRIADKLEEILKEQTFDYLVRERGFSRFNNVTQVLFKVVGIVDLICIDYYNNEIMELTPTHVKKVITNNGKASKKEVEDSVRKYLPDDLKDIKFKIDDCSDAFAVGVTYLIEKNLIKKYKLS